MLHKLHQKVLESFLTTAMGHLGDKLRIRSLNISSINCTHSSYLDVNLCIPHFPHLTSLTISGNRSVESITFFSLAQHCPNLETLIAEYLPKRLPLEIEESILKMPK